MTEHPTQPTGTDSASTQGSADRERGVQLMVVGAVVAVLAPLAGFLGGSIVGPDKQLGDFDAMYVSLFVGLVIGGIGAVTVLLGLLRWVRGSRAAGTL